MIIRSSKLIIAAALASMLAAFAPARALEIIDGGGDTL